MLYIALAAAALLAGLDQLTKYLVHTNMELHESIPIIQFGDTHVLSITSERNTGAAFSILEGKQIFLSVFVSIVLIVLLYLLLSKKVKRTPYIWSMALIISGGVGNLIDRVFRGYVVDFIDVKIINFAVFNIADICAVCGSALLLILVILDEIKESRLKKAQEAQKGDVSASKTNVKLERLEDGKTQEAEKADNSDTADGDND